jgi:hypothetical protein
VSSEKIVADSDFEKVYAGLGPDDWHTLKNLVLAAADGASNITIPPYLLSHEAAAYLQSFVVTRDKKQLDEAAKSLCPLYPDKAWLALAKS